MKRAEFAARGGQLGVILTTALLCGCGTAQPPVNAAGFVAAQALSHHRTFHFTGSGQSFTVPAGVRWITVVALGAAGGGSAGGHGGRVYAQFPVTPHEHLAIFVGGTTAVQSGGYNGGGAGLYGTDISYGGGGASDIREGGKTLQNRILIAGGGGGEGGFDSGGYGAGGKGGGSTAGSGAAGRGTSSRGYTNAGGGGSGGAQNSGGSGGGAGRGGYQDGYPGVGGELGAGGNGGPGTGENGGGGGGGGYYGGGGGGGGGWAYGDYIGGGGGGGGGSSYVESSARKFESWQGWKTADGNGLVVLSW
jgi:hypothetical protein